MLLNSFVMVVKTGPGLVKVFGASCCNDAKGFTSRASNLKPYPTLLLCEQ